MDRSGRTVVRIVAWEEDVFGILVDYDDGGWRKYRVGTIEQARKELERLSFEKRQRYYIKK
jgi:hypothetical protein